MHLVSGPLGTLAGLYKTSIDRLMRPDPDSPPPKIIASTATVRRAGAQIQALFAHRQSAYFRHRAPSAATTSSPALSLIPNKPASMWASVPRVATSRVCCCGSYLALMAAAQKAWADHLEMGTANPADPYMTL